jgi:hypothetical protein
MDFKDLDLSRLELFPLNDNPAAGFTLTVMVSRGDERFDPKKFELPTWAGMLFKALIKAHRDQAAEIGELRARLEGKKPAAAKKARAA